MKYIRLQVSDNEMKALYRKDVEPRHAFEEFVRRRFPHLLGPV